ncbi:hypothetical protein [Croceicoccus hydrothermalis]|uniref:hypothetical protein n=1 Tax=Croceicoccus hydrothermalis TaxID=2867964 RepID=UPI001EFB29CC|nr:hypothetical protein [Croceicoccus hydrothermalis]
MRDPQQPIEGGSPRGLSAFGLPNGFALSEWQIGQKLPFKAWPANDAPWSSLVGMHRTAYCLNRQHSDRSDEDRQEQFYPLYSIYTGARDNGARHAIDQIRAVGRPDEHDLAHVRLCARYGHL